MDADNGEMDEVVAEFLIESYENLDRLDRDLVELEQNPSADKLAGIFRTIHTIKGTSRLPGLRQARVDHPRRREPAVPPAGRRPGPRRRHHVGPAGAGRRRPPDPRRHRGRRDGGRRRLRRSSSSSPLNRATAPAEADEPEEHQSRRRRCRSGRWPSRPARRAPRPWSGPSPPNATATPATSVRSSSRPASWSRATWSTRWRPKPSSRAGDGRQQHPGRRRPARQADEPGRRAGPGPQPDPAVHRDARRATPAFVAHVAAAEPDHHRAAGRRHEDPHAADRQRLEQVPPRRARPGARLRQAGPHRDGRARRPSSTRRSSRRSRTRSPTSSATPSTTASRRPTAAWPRGKPAEGRLLAARLPRGRPGQHRDLRRRRRHRPRARSSARRSSGA